MPVLSDLNFLTPRLYYRDRSSHSVAMVGDEVTNLHPHAMSLLILWPEVRAHCTSYCHQGYCCCYVLSLGLLNKSFPLCYPPGLEGGAGGNSTLPLF